MYLINGSPINSPLGAVVAPGGGPTVLQAHGHQSGAHGKPEAQQEEVPFTQLLPEGHRVTQHGQPRLEVSLQASGATTTRHGSARAGVVLQVHAAENTTQHGKPVLQMNLRVPSLGAITRHGTPSQGDVLLATGHMASQHGTPTLFALAGIEAQGTCSTAHGTPAVGGVTLYARPLANITRHGTPQIIRGHRC